MSEFVRIIDPSGKTLRNDLYNSPPDTVSYIISKDGDLIKAKNGRTGQIEFSETDAATVIQNALNSGKSIFIKDIIEIKTGITVPSYKTILSDGQGGLKAADNANLSYLLKLSPNTKFVKIYNLQLNGNKDNGNPNITGVLVQADTPDKAAGWSQIYACRIINCNNGVYLKGYSDSFWERVWHMQIIGNWFGGVDGPNNINIKGEYAHVVPVIGNSLEDASTAIHLNYCRGWIIHGNWFDDHADYGIYLTEPASEYPYSTIINGNYFTDSGINNASIYIPFRAVENLITNNQVTFVNKYGIHLEGRYNRIVGNNIYGKSGSVAGIYCENDGKLNIISSNNIINFDQYGIYVEVGTTYSIIANNTIFYCGTGIYFRGSHSIIQDNCLFANTTQADIVNTDGIVKDNVNYATENEGIATFSGDGSTTTFSIPHGLVSTPSKYGVSPLTPDADAPRTITVDATNITITFSTAPPSGTDNIKFGWWARV